MKSPVANTSPEAVALREAALAFARHATDEPNDPDDREGQRLNAALLRAAEQYAARTHKAQALPTHRRCIFCGKLTHVTTAGCDHCNVEDK